MTAQLGVQAAVTGPAPQVFCSHCAKMAPPWLTRQNVPAGQVIADGNPEHSTAQDVPSSTVHELLLQVARVRLPPGQAS